MKILGIDYGTKRVGVALSDESNTFALPVGVIANTHELLTEVEKLARTNGAAEVVIGESMDYAGKANPVQSAVLAFKKELESLGFIVHLEPEFMTSMHVERLQGKNNQLDASSAAIILQTFLDKRKNTHV